MRKSVGRLDGIVQPVFNFTASDPNYFDLISAGLDDLPSQLAMNMTSDGEADFQSLAATLAPQRDYADISDARHV